MSLGTMKMKKSIYSIGMVIGLIVLMFGAYNFHIGFHGIDIAHNEMRIQQMLYEDGYNYTFKEVDLKNNPHSLHYTFSLGLYEIMIGFYYALAGMFVMVFCYFKSKGGRHY